jgi:hypothetical protein
MPRDDFDKVVALVCCVSQRCRKVMNRFKHLSSKEGKRKGKRKECQPNAIVTRLSISEASPSVLRFRQQSQCYYPYRAEEPRNNTSQRHSLGNEPMQFLGLENACIVVELGFPGEAHDAVDGDDAWAEAGSRP